MARSAATQWCLLVAILVVTHAISAETTTNTTEYTDFTPTENTTMDDLTGTTTAPPGEETNTTDEDTPTSTQPPTMEENTTGEDSGTTQKSNTGNATAEGVSATISQPVSVDDATAEGVSATISHPVRVDDGTTEGDSTITTQPVSVDDVTTNSGDFGTSMQPPDIATTASPAPDATDTAKMSTDTANTATDVPGVTGTTATLSDMANTATNALGIQGTVSTPSDSEITATSPPGAQDTMTTPLDTANTATNPPDAQGTTTKTPPDTANTTTNLPDAQGTSTTPPDTANAATNTPDANDTTTKSPGVATTTQQYADTGATPDYCSSDPCKYGATCVNGDSGFVCTCAAGYTDTKCETKHIRYYGRFRVPKLTYTVSLKDINSSNYIDLAANVTKVLTGIYRESVGSKLVNVTYIKFAKGSVVVDYSLWVDSSLRDKEMLKDVLLKHSDFKIGGFDVERESIRISDKKLDGTAFPWLAVVLGTILSVVLLILVVTLVIFTMRKVREAKSRRRESSDDEVSTRYSPTATKRHLTWQEGKPSMLVADHASRDRYDRERMTMINRALSKVPHIDWSVMRNFAQREAGQQGNMLRRGAPAQKGNDVWSWRQAD